MIPRDILRTVPRPANADQVAIDRWKELGADGVIVGTVRKGPEGIIVEARLIKVADGTMALGKQYSGSPRSVTRRRRVYAHSFAGRGPQDPAQSARRREDEAGVLVEPRRRANEGPGRRAGHLEHLPVGLRRREPDAVDDDPVARHRAGVVAGHDARSPTRRTARGYPDIILHSLKRRAGAHDARAREQREPQLPARVVARRYRSSRSCRTATATRRSTSSTATAAGCGAITNHPTADVTPTWSPTGTQLAFTSDRGGTPQVYIVNVDGTGRSTDERREHIATARRGRPAA